MDEPDDWEDLDDTARQARRRAALTEFTGALGLWFEEDGSLIRGTSQIAVYRNDYYGNFEILEHNKYDEFYWHGQTVLKTALMTREEKKQQPFKAIDEFELGFGLREDVWQEYVQTKLKPMVQADQKERHPRLARDVADRLLRAIEDPDGDVSHKESDNAFSRLMAPRRVEPTRPTPGTVAAPTRRGLDNAYDALAAQQRQRTQSASRSTASSAPTSRPATPNISAPAQPRATAAAASARPRSTPVFPAQPPNPSQVPRPVPRLPSRDVPGPALVDPRPSVSSGAMAGNRSAHAPPPVRAATSTLNQGRPVQNLPVGASYIGSLSPQARPAGPVYPQQTPRSLTAASAYPAVPQRSPLQRKHQAAHMPAPHGQGPPIAHAPPAAHAQPAHAQPAHDMGPHGQGLLPMQQGVGFQPQQQRPPYERGPVKLQSPYVRPSRYAPSQVPSPGVMSPYITASGQLHPTMQNSPLTYAGALNHHPRYVLQHPAYDNLPPGLSVPHRRHANAQHGQPAGARPPSVAPVSPGNVDQQQPVWDPAMRPWVLRYPHARHHSQ